MQARLKQGWAEVGERNERLVLSHYAYMENIRNSSVYAIKRGYCVYWGVPFHQEKIKGWKTE